MEKIDIRKLAKEVLRLLPELIKTDEQLAYELYTALQKYFVPRDLFERIMKLLEDVRTEMTTIRKEVKETREEHGRKLDWCMRCLKEHGKILERHEKILEEHSKILKRHGRILEEHSRILKKHDKKLNWLMSAMTEIKRTMGAGFESVARKITGKYLKDLGIIPKDAELKSKVFTVCGKTIEVNIFYENPLILGEVTAMIWDPKEFIRMVDKFKAIETALGRKSRLRVVYIGGIASDVYEKITEIAKREGIELVIGEVIEL